MKINQGYTDPKANSPQEINNAGRAQETGAVGKGRSGAAAAGGGPPDEVTLSSLASAVQGALSDSPERAAYLEKLASEFASGTYQPDVVKTVQGIIDDAFQAQIEKPGA